MTTTEQLGHLRGLTLALGEAVTIDEVARTALTAAMELPGVLRAGLGVSQGAGRQLQFVSTDETADAPAVRWCLIDAYDDLPLTHAVRDAADVYVPTLEDLADRFPDIMERQRSLGTRSMAALALVRNKECLGALLLSFDAEMARDAGDRDFLAAFAAQVTQAVRRGLAYQIQHTNSEQLQRSLMPHSLPELDGLALGSYYQPGGLNVDVGGDWYDVIGLDDGSVVVALGDVMGKGVEAAIVMSEVRAAMRAYAILDATPGVVLDRLDRLVTSFAVPEQIVTMLYGLIDPERTSMRLSVAGHPAPLMIPASGMPTVLEGELGPGPWDQRRALAGEHVQARRRQHRPVLQRRAGGDAHGGPRPRHRAVAGGARRDGSAPPEPARAVRPAQRTRTPRGRRRRRHGARRVRHRRPA